MVISEIVYSVLIAIAVAGAITGLIEIRQLIIAHREGPREPVTGTQALVGRKARACQDFALSPDRSRLEGKVMVNGEVWKAEAVHRLDDPPRRDEEVEIVDVDTARLTIQVK